MKTQNTTARVNLAPFVLIAAILGLIVAAVMLYPFARDSYIAQRYDERATAEKEATASRADRIEQKTKDLQTPEGIADRALEEYFMSGEGEQVVSILGLTSSKSSMKLPDQIEPGSVEAAEEWWTQTLDEFFGVEPVTAKEKPTNNSIPGL